MNQLRLAYVNLKLVSNDSRSMNPSSNGCARCSAVRSFSLADKAIRLQQLRPGAAEVIEELIDDALSHIA